MSFSANNHRIWLERRPMIYANFERGTQAVTFNYEPWPGQFYSHVEACGSRSCLSCPLLANGTSSNISTITNKRFAIKTCNNVSNITCATSGVIYLIQCKKCRVQYIGMTRQTLRQRLGQHRRKIQQGDTSTFLYDHFALPNHSVNDVSVSVIEFVTDIKTSDADELLRQRENFWIRTFCTAYPYGLNDRIDGCRDISNGYCPTDDAKQPYFSKPILRRKRSHGQRRRKRKVPFNPSRCIQDLATSFNNDNNCRHLYLLLRSLPGSNVKTLFKAFSNPNNFIDVNPYFKLAFLGFFAGKYNNFMKNIRPKEDSIRVPATFVNKGLDLINPISIIKHSRCTRLLPTDRNAVKNIIISYKLAPPVSLRLQNYSSFLSKFNVNMLNTVLRNCSCASSEFIYQPAGHVITGNLNIVNNHKLRQLFQRGTKYRVANEIDKNALKEELKGIITRLTDKLSQKHRIPSVLFREYQERAYELINERVANLVIPQLDYCNLANVEIKRELNHLQKLYIITCADKASNNFVFTCKSYYCQTLASEMGITFDTHSNQWILNGNDTYESTALSADQITSLHESFAKSQPYCLVARGNFLRIPRVYIIPKLHKNPYKFRPIAGAKNSSMQSLSRMLHYILSMFKVHFHNYCEVVRRRTGIRCYLAIDSNEAVLKDTQSSLGSNNIRCANSFDFSTLYTKLPLNTVCDQLYYLCDLLFKNNRNKQYVLVNKSHCVGDKTFSLNSSCFYSGSVGSERYSTLTIQDIKELIRFCLFEYYVCLGSHHFKAKCGIAQGSIASPTVALMTLAVLEYKFLTSPDNRSISKRLSNSWRYIDDILVINIPASEFLDIAKLMYPASLPLSHSSGYDSFCAFLDLQLRFNPDFQVSVYDKTADFNFSVVKFIFADSNAPEQLGYNVLFAQAIRYARICSNIHDFILKLRDTVTTVKAHGFVSRKLLITLRKFAIKYGHLLLKYGITNAKEFEAIVARRVI